MQIVGNAESKIKFETGLKIKLVIVNETQPENLAEVAAKVVDDCCTIWATTKEYVAAKERQRDRVCMRSLVFHLLRTKYKMPLPFIGKLFNCDHTTVIHNIKTAENLLFTSDELMMLFYNPIKHLYESKI